MTSEAMYIKNIEESLKPQFEAVEEIAQFNQERVLEAFKKNRISLNHFYGSTGYGYGDLSRDTLYSLFADIVGAESAIISPMIMSGTHSIGMALYGLLRPYDNVLSVTGRPYDTLEEVLASKNGSLSDYFISFEDISLCGDNFDFDKIKQMMAKKKYKMIYVQRSRGYAWRNALSITQIQQLVDFVKSIDKDIIVFIDNCYTEFVDTKEPTAVGADIICGSMIKNPGAGIVPTGGYIAGKAKYIEMIGGRFTVPSVGLEIGSYELGYRMFYQAMFLAPHTVSQSVKGSLLFGKMMEDLGYETLPKAGEKCDDITRCIKFNTEEEVCSFIQNIQEVSPVDAHVKLEAWDMPGYTSKVIMAAGCFVGGASSELSADAPIVEPYIAYMQGGLTYEHCKYAAKVCAKTLKEKRK
ncbi:MAG: methionine gamma-lyase family protein [Bacillota bacterium]